MTAPDSCPPVVASTPPAADSAPLAAAAGTLGLAALEVSRGELARGVREVPPGSNDGPDVRAYRAGCLRHGALIHLGPCPWCACFVGWCLDAAYNGEGSIGFVRWPWRASVAEIVEDAKAMERLRTTDLDAAPIGSLLIYGRDGHSPLTGGTGHVAIKSAPTLAISGNSHDRVEEVAIDRGAGEPLVAWVALG